MSAGDTVKHKNQIMCREGNSAVLSIQCGRCSCAHQTNFTSPFQYKSSQCQM